MQLTVLLLAVDTQLIVNFSNLVNVMTSWSKDIFSSARCPLNTSRDHYYLKVNLANPVSNLKPHRNRNWTIINICSEFLTFM